MHHNAKIYLLSVNIECMLLWFIYFTYYIFNFKISYFFRGCSEMLCYNPLCASYVASIILK